MIIRTRAKQTPLQMCHAEYGVGRSQAADSIAGRRAKAGADVKEKSPRYNRFPTGWAFSRDSRGRLALEAW